MTDKPIFIQFNGNYDDCTVNIDEISFIKDGCVVLKNGTQISIAHHIEMALYDLLAKYGKVYKLTEAPCGQYFTFQMTKYHKKVAVLGFSERNLTKEQVIDKYNELIAEYNELVGEIKVLKKALEFACGIADCNWCIYAKECDTEVTGCAELILQKATAEIEQEEQE